MVQPRIPPRPVGDPEAEAEWIRKVLAGESFDVTPSEPTLVVDASDPENIEVEFDGAPAEEHPFGSGYVAAKGAVSDFLGNPRSPIKGGIDQAFNAGLLPTPQAPPPDAGLPAPDPGLSDFMRGVQEDQTPIPVPLTGDAAKSAGTLGFEAALRKLGRGTLEALGIFPALAEVGTRANEFIGYDPLGVSQAIQLAGGDTDFKPDLTAFQGMPTDITQPRQLIRDLAEQNSQRTGLQQLLGGALYDLSNLAPGIGFIDDVTRLGARGINFGFAPSTPISQAPPSSLLRQMMEAPASDLGFSETAQYPPRSFTQGPPPSSPSGISDTAQYPPSSLTAAPPPSSPSGISDTAQYPPLGFTDARPAIYPTVPTELGEQHTFYPGAPQPVNERRFQIADWDAVKSESPSVRGGPARSVRYEVTSPDGFSWTVEVRDFSGADRQLDASIFPNNPSNRDLTYESLPPLNRLGIRRMLDDIAQEFPEAESIGGLRTAQHASRDQVFPLRRAGRPRAEAAAEPPSGVADDFEVVDERQGTLDAALAESPVVRSVEELEAQVESLKQQRDAIRLAGTDPDNPMAGVPIEDLRRMGDINSQIDVVYREMDQNYPGYRETYVPGAAQPVEEVTPPAPPQFGRQPGRPRPPRANASEIGSPGRLRYLLGQTPEELGEEGVAEIEHLIQLHEHADPWVRDIAKQFDAQAAGQMDLFRQAAAPTNQVSEVSEAPNTVPDTVPDTVPERFNRTLNPDANEATHDYQFSVLEMQPKAIHRLGDAASTNVGFRLENAGDALRESAGWGESSYIDEKLARIGSSLNDSEWQLPLSEEAQGMIARLKEDISQIPVASPKHEALRDLMLAVADRDTARIRTLIQRYYDQDIVPDTGIHREIAERHRKAKRPNVQTAERDLTRLDQAHYYVKDAQEAFDEYRGLLQNSFVRAEDYRAARAEAWDNFVDELDRIRNITPARLGEEGVVLSADAATDDVPARYLQDFDDDNLPTADELLGEENLRRIARDDELAEIGRQRDLEANPLPPKRERVKPVVLRKVDGRIQDSHGFYRLEGDRGRWVVQRIDDPEEQYLHAKIADAQADLLRRAQAQVNEGKILDGGAPIPDEALDVEVLPDGTIEVEPAPVAELAESTAEMDRLEQLRDIAVDDLNQLRLYLERAGVTFNGREIDFVPDDLSLTAHNYLEDYREQLSKVGSREDAIAIQRRLTGQTQTGGAVQPGFGIGEAPQQGGLFPESSTAASSEPLIDADQLRAERARREAIEEGQQELPEPEIAPEVLAEFSPELVELEDARLALDEAQATVDALKQPGYGGGRLPFGSREFEERAARRREETARTGVPYQPKTKAQAEARAKLEQAKLRVMEMENAYEQRMNQSIDRAGQIPPGQRLSEQRPDLGLGGGGQVPPGNLPPGSGGVDPPDDLGGILDLFRRFMNDPARATEFQEELIRRRRVRGMRSARFRDRVDDLFANDVPMREAMAIGRRELENELPSVGSPLEVLATPSVHEALTQEVWLQLGADEPLEALATVQALDRAVAEGRIPRTPGAQGGSAFTRLQRVFGDEMTRVLDQGRPLQETIRRIAAGTLEITGPAGPAGPGNTFGSTQRYGTSRMFGSLDSAGRQVFGVPARGIGEVPLEPVQWVRPGQAPVPRFSDEARPPRVDPFQRDINVQNFRLQTETQPPPGTTGGSTPPRARFGGGRMFGEEGRERQVLGFQWRNIPESALEPGRPIPASVSPVPNFPPGERPPRVSSFQRDIDVQTFRLRTDTAPAPGTQGVPLPPPLRFGDITMTGAPGQDRAVPRRLPEMRIDPNNELSLRGQPVPDILGQPTPPGTFVDRPSVRKAEYERELDLQVFRELTGEAAPPTGPTRTDMLIDPPKDLVVKQVSQFPEETKERMLRWAKNAGLTAQDTGNLLRANMASVDLSYLRQQAFLILPYWKEFGHSFPRAIKAGFSESYAKELNRQIYSDPYMRYYDELGLDFLRPLDAKAVQEWQRAEEFMILGGQRPLQRLAARLPWVTHSGYAYITGMNTMNWKIFKAHVQMLERESLDIASGAIKLKPMEVFDIEESVRKFGHFLEDTSGRGRIPEGLKQYTGLVNGLAFSLRLQIGRFKSARHLISSDKYVRRAAIRAWVRSLGIGMSAVTAGHLMGWWSTSFDPRSSDYMKIIVGDTRLDIFGGYQQYAVLLARLIMSASQNNLVSTEGEASWVDPITLLPRFARSKVHPAINNVLTAFTGRDFRGAKVDRSDPWYWVRQNGMLGVVDIYESIESEGLIGIPLGIAGVLGGGVASYEPAERRGNSSPIPRHRLPGR